MNKRANLIKDTGKCGSIISNAVSFCTVILDADELASSITSILRMRPANNPTRAVEEAWRLARNRQIALGERPSWVGAVENIALSPGCDSGGASIENYGTAHNADSNRHVVQFHIVEHERTRQFTVAWFRCSQENGRIGRYSVDDGQSASSLIEDIKLGYHDWSDSLKDAYLPDRCWISLLSQYQSQSASLMSTWMYERRKCSPDNW